jgi:hypothetical protein
LPASQFTVQERPAGQVIVSPPHDCASLQFTTQSRPAGQTTPPSQFPEAPPVQSTVHVVPSQPPVQIALGQEPVTGAVLPQPTQLVPTQKLLPEQWL